MIPADHHVHGPVRPQCAIGDDIGARTDGLQLAGAKRRNRRYPEAAEIIGALPPDVQAEGPHQAAQRPPQRGCPHDPAERGNVGDRCGLGMPDQRVDLRECQRIRGTDMLRQDAILAVVMAGHGDHADAARQFIEMRPRPFQIQRAQHRFVARDDAERLGEDRGPADTHGRNFAGFRQAADIQGSFKRDERHAHRGAHQVDDQTARR